MMPLIFSKNLSLVLEHILYIFLFWSYKYHRSKSISLILTPKQWQRVTTIFLSSKRRGPNIVSRFAYSSPQSSPESAQSSSTDSPTYHHNKNCSKDTLGSELSSQSYGSAYTGLSPSSFDGIQYTVTLSGIYSLSGHHPIYT